MGSQRKRCESEIYHVISRGTGRQLIFEDDEDRELFLGLLERSAKNYSVEIMAWCLMGNHVHLLLHAPLDRISLCMKLICGRYAQLFNQRHGRTGHLFQERFKSEPIEDDSYLIVVISYIHYNPEKAGIAQQESYPWSSYGEYAGRKGSRRICATDLALDMYGGVKGLERYHREHAAEASCMDVESLRSRTRAMPDESAIALANEVLGGMQLNDLKTLNRQQRNAALRKLLAARLSVRQIERLTGISRGVIQSIKPEVS